MEFPGGYISELAASITAEMIYVQCNVNGNEFLLFKEYVDHKKTCLALSVEDQKIVVKG